MKVKKLKNLEKYIVYTTHGGNILFTHQNKKQCYEWIFSKLHWT